MDERERLAFLTSHYNRLKNLRLAPVYLIFIASPWTPFERWDLRTALLPICIYVAICFAWYWLLNRFYKERYGRIEESRDWESWQKRRSAAWPLAVPVLFATYFVIRAQHIPSDFILLGVPGALIAEGLSYSNVKVRRFYYVLGSAISFVGLLPSLVPAMPGHQFVHTYDMTFIGVALLMVAILDHLVLTSSFRQSPREICA